MTQALDFSDARKYAGQILVELDPHRTGASATGRSSCADAAAKVMAARTSGSASAARTAQGGLAGEDEKYTLVLANPPFAGSLDMTSKTSDRRPFIGEWRIIDIKLWDREDLDLLGPAYLTPDRGGLAAMRFLAIEAGR